MDLTDWESANPGLLHVPSDDAEWGRVLALLTTRWIGDKFLWSHCSIRFHRWFILRRLGAILGRPWLGPWGSVAWSVWALLQGFPWLWVLRCWAAVWRSWRFANFNAARHG